MKKVIGKIFMITIVLTMVLCVIPRNVYATEVNQITNNSRQSSGEASGITRAEWLSDLVKTFDMTVEDDNYPDNYFSDLDSSSEYYYDILVAVQFGVINVEAGDPVNPNDTVTREFAASTLNYCLGYQLGENVSYTFSDLSKVEYKEDAQIAIDRGWFSLIDGAFCPSLNVTSLEVNKMLEDARTIWQSTDVDSNYNNTYDLANGVIDISQNVEAYLLDDGRIYIVNCPKVIVAGKQFAVTLSNVLCVYQAKKVEQDGTDLIVTGEEVDHDDAYDNVDMQGTIDASALQIGEAAKGLSVDYTESDNSSAKSRARSRSTINLDKYTTLKVSGDIKLNDVQSVSVNMKVKNAKIDYAVSLTGETFVKLRGDSELTCSAKFDGMKAIGMDEITLVPAQIPGIGGLDLILELSAGGKFSCKTMGYITTGISYSKANGFRVIKGFNAKSFNFTCEANASAGLKARLGISGKLVPVKGYVYTKAGGKAILKQDTYDKGDPKTCSTFVAYIYASTGASANIKLGSLKGSFEKDSEIFGQDNSPLRVYHHYENGKEVAKCSRGNDFKYYTKYGSKYWDCGWTDGTGSYAYDESGKQIPVYTYTLDDNNNATITGYNGSASYLHIPETIDGYTVVAIGQNTFKGNTTIISMDISDTVTSIGSGAFADTALKSLTLPPNVKKLGGRILGNNIGVTKITIPKTVTESYDFYGIYLYGPFSGSNIQTAIIENGMTELPAHLLEGATELAQVSLPDTITSIGSGVFADTALKSLTLPPNVKKLGGRILGNNIGVTKITIPKTVIESYDFYGIYLYGPFSGSNIQTAVIENGMTELPAHLLEGATELAEVSLPDTVTSIGSGAFADTALKSLILPPNVKKLGGRVFSNTSLSNIEIPDSVINMGSNVFLNCSNLETFKWNNAMSEIPSSTFENCTKLTEVNFPASVKTIGDHAFKGCTGLKNIYWGESVTSIEAYAFENCDSLTSVFIPETIDSLGKGVFYDCDSMVDVHIPDSVEDLGSQMFYDCDVLADVKLGSGVKSIPSSMFEHCDVLKSIVLPYKVTSIGASAFKDAVAFTSITIPRTTTTIDSTAFSYPDKLTIYGVSGTYAETFANEKGIKFVNQAINAKEVSLSESDIIINKGKKKTIKLSVNPSNFTDEVTWKSSDPTVATVTSDGVITAEGAGTTTIKVTVGNISVNCKVTVVQSVTGISLNKTSLDMEALDSYQLVATVNPSTANDRSVTWSSSNPEVATVDDKGLVTAVVKGKATITVQSNDGSEITKTCNVNVKNTVHICTSVDEMESGHNYENNCSDYWIYTVPGAARLAVAFDEKTDIEDGFDYLYIYDAKDEQIGKYTGKALSSKIISLSGDTVKIKLASDHSGSAWGFKVTRIDDSCQHSSTSVKNQKEATCTVEGYTGDKVCLDCGMTIEKGTAVAAKGHTPVDTQAIEPTCTKEGRAEGKYCSVCKEVLEGMEPLSVIDHTYKTITTKAKVNKNGSIVKKCINCGDVLTKSTIYYPKTVTLSKISYVYNGKVQKPSVVIKGANGKIIASKNYTLTYSKGRKNVGKYIVKIIFKGNFSGTINRTFKINPKGTVLTTLVARSKGVIVKWKKQASQTTGYQIQYSTSSKFTKPKVVTITKNSMLSKTVTKLSGKKKYYVRIRTYKTVSGIKYYSDWSKAKNVVTKK